MEAKGTTPKVKFRKIKQGQVSHKHLAPADSSAMVSFLTQFKEKNMQAVKNATTALINKEMEGFGVFLSGRLAGMIVYVVDDEYADIKIENVFVLPALIELGIGCVLCDHFKEFAADEYGAVNINLPYMEYDRYVAYMEDKNKKSIHQTRVEENQNSTKTQKQASGWITDTSAIATVATASPIKPVFSIPSDVPKQRLNDNTHNRMRNQQQQQQQQQPFIKKSSKQNPASADKKSNAAKMPARSPKNKASLSTGASKETSKEVLLTQNGADAKPLDKKQLQSHDCNHKIKQMVPEHGTSENSDMPANQSNKQVHAPLDSMSLDHVPGVLVSDSAISEITRGAQKQDQIFPTTSKKESIFDDSSLDALIDDDTIINNIGEQEYDPFSDTVSSVHTLPQPIADTTVEPHTQTTIISDNVEEPHDYAVSASNIAIKHDDRALPEQNAIESNRSLTKDNHVECIPTGGAIQTPCTVEENRETTDTVPIQDIEIVKASDCKKEARRVIESGHKKSPRKPSKQAYVQEENSLGDVNKPVRNKKNERLVVEKKAEKKTDKAKQKKAADTNNAAETKNKKKAIIIIVSVLIAVALIACGVVFRPWEMIKATPSDSQTTQTAMVTIEVKKDDTVGEVLAKIEDSALNIKKSTMLALLETSGKDVSNQTGVFQPGTYEFDPATSVEDVYSRLISGQYNITYKIAIAENMNLDEICYAVEHATSSAIPSDQFKQALLSQTMSMDMFDSVSVTEKEISGYVFAQAYYYERGDSPEDVAIKLLTPCRRQFQSSTISAADFAKLIYKSSAIAQTAKNDDDKRRLSSVFDKTSATIEENKAITAFDLTAAENPIETTSTSYTVADNGRLIFN